MIEKESHSTFSLFSNLFSKDLKCKYFLFSNKDNKIWVVPEKNSKTALNLYQPSAIKGIAIKKFLPLLIKVQLFHNFLKLKSIKGSIEPQLLKLFNIIFNNTICDFSIFSGTPSIHQKVTIQIFKENNILGYCKVTESDEIKLIFKHEQEMLDFLQTKGILNIPKCLYCDHLKDSQLSVFVQDTIKSNKSKVIHSWKKHHWEFLESLFNKTKKNIVFEDSDFHRSIQILEANLKYLQQEQAAIINKVINNIIQHYKSKKVDFGVIHRDFTPWNMFTEKGSLFVFDFEYAQYTYPPFLDYFHFFTQTSIFEKRWNAEQILKQFKKNILSLKEHFSDPVFSYQCYLLDIISLFLERDKGKPTADIKKNLEIWIKILSLL